jgi:hypothetical protein
MGGSGGCSPPRSLGISFPLLREKPSAGKPRQGHPAVHPIAPSHNCCFRLEKLCSLLGITLLDSFAVRRRSTLSGGCATRPSNLDTSLLQRSAILPSLPRRRPLPKYFPLASTSTIAHDCERPCRQKESRCEIDAWDRQACSTT